MNLFKLLIIIILSVLSGIGGYWVFNQARTSSNLNSQAKATLSSICTNPDKINDAANCLTQNYIITFGLNRANQLVNQSSVPTAAEATQMTAGLVECGLKCGGGAELPRSPQNSKNKM